MKLDDIAKHAADSINQIARRHPAPGLDKPKPIWRQRFVVGLAAAVVTLVAVGAALLLTSPDADRPLDTTTLAPGTTFPPVTTTLPPTTTTVIPAEELPLHVRVATPAGVINLPGGEFQQFSEDLSAPCCVSMVDDGNGGVYVARPIEFDDDGIVYTDTPYEIVWLELGESPVVIYSSSGRVRIHQLVMVDGNPALVATIVDPNPALEGSEVIALLDVGSGGVTEVADIGQLETGADKVTYSDGLFVVTQITHSSGNMFTVDLNGTIDRMSFPTGEGEIHFAVPYVGGTFSPDGSTIAVVYQEWIQDPNGTAGELRVERADLLLLDREGNELNRWRIFTNDFEDAYDAAIAVDFDGRFVMVATIERSNEPETPDRPKSRVYWVDTAGDTEPSRARGWDEMEILDLKIATGREPAPSQSPADAARDGVVAEVAALPFEQRVNEVARLDILSRGRDTAYILSRMNLGGVPTIGTCPSEGECLYGRDFASPSEYGEVLLVAGDQILKAYPFPGYPPQQLISGPDDGIYCLRQGDGGLPDSMICRIDRNTGEAVVRIFPFTDTYRPEWTPGNWTVEETTPDVLFQELIPRLDGSLVISGQGGTRFVDATTLEIVGNTCNQSDQFGFIRSFDGTSFAYDDAEWLTGEEADQAAIAAGEIDEGDTVPNGYYIRNQSEATRTLRLADDALVCMSSIKYGPVTDQLLTVDEFFDEIEDLDRDKWITDPLTNGSWVDVNGGLVTRLVVQYQP